MKAPVPKPTTYEWAAHKNTSPIGSDLRRALPISLTLAAMGCGLALFTESSSVLFYMLLLSILAAVVSLPQVPREKEGS